MSGVTNIAERRMIAEYDSIAADAKRIIELREQRRKGAGHQAAGLGNTHEALGL